MEGGAEVGGDEVVYKGGVGEVEEVVGEAVALVEGIVFFYFFTAYSFRFSYYLQCLFLTKRVPTPVSSCQGGIAVYAPYTP